MTTGGSIQLLRTSDAAIMIRIELPMPVMVSQVRTRAQSARSVTEPTAGGLEMSPVVLRIYMLLVAQ
jgi:ABC-type tungstate transport system substrate-binding protein